MHEKFFRLLITVRMPRSRRVILTILRRFHISGVVFIKALEKQDTLYYNTISDAVISEMGLSLSDIAKNKEMREDVPQADKVRKAFNEFILYRIYEDLERGWRVVQPNLEQCGLLQFQYQNLHDIVRTEDIWKFCGEKFYRRRGVGKQSSVLFVYDTEHDAEKAGN